MGCKDKFLRLAGASAGKRVLLAQLSVRDVGPGRTFPFASGAQERRSVVPRSADRGLCTAQARFGRSSALGRPSAGRAFGARSSRRPFASGAMKARAARKSGERSCRAHGSCAPRPGCRESGAATRLPGKVTLAAAEGTPKTATCAAYLEQHQASVGTAALPSL